MSKPRNIIIALALFLAVLAVVVGVRFGLNPRPDVVVTEEAIDSQIDMLKERDPEAFKGAKGEAVEANYREKIAEQLKVQQLLLKEAEAVGQQAQPTEIDAAISQVRAAYGSEAKFTKALKERGMTLADYKVSIESQITSSKMMAEITKDIDVSEKDARAYYTANKSRYTDPKDPTKTKPFKQVAKEITDILRAQKQNQAFNEFLAGLRLEARSQTN